MTLLSDRRRRRRGAAAPFVESLDARRMFSTAVADARSPLAKTTGTASVSIAPVDASTQEGSDRALVRLTRTGDASASLRVQLKWIGSAKKADLVKQPKYATFAAGATTVDVAVRAIEDRKAEATETAKIAVQSGPGYAVATGGNSAASVLILDGRTDLRWRQVTSGPSLRVEPETAVVDGKMYVFSGYANDHWQPIRRADNFDPATGTWTRLGDMPIGITHAAVAVVGRTIWFAGGYEERVGTTGSQDIAVTSVRIYDTQTDTWSDGPALPAQRGSGGLSLVDNKLYFYGGEQRDRTDVTDTWALDLSDASARWATRAPMPKGRTHFGTAAIDGQIYVFGGWQGVDADATVLKEAYAYDTRANTWRRLRDLPTPMSHLSPATTAYEGKVYMLGGEYAWNAESTQVLEYDPRTDRYRKLSDLPVDRASAAVGVVGDQFVFSGGKKDGWHDETFVGTWI